MCRLREPCAIGHAWQPRSSPGGGRQGQSCCQRRLHWIGPDSSIPLLRCCHNVCPQCHHLSVAGNDIFGLALSAAAPEAVRTRTRTGERGGMSSKLTTWRLTAFSPDFEVPAGKARTR
jgi:hypothetical protein